MVWFYSSIPQLIHVFCIPHLPMPSFSATSIIHRHLLLPQHRLDCEVSGNQLWICLWMDSLLPGWFRHCVQINFSSDKRVTLINAISAYNACKLYQRNYCLQFSHLMLQCPLQGNMLRGVCEGQCTAQLMPLLHRVFYSTTQGTCSRERATSAVPLTGSCY